MADELKPEEQPLADYSEDAMLGTEEETKEETPETPEEESAEKVETETENADETAETETEKTLLDELHLAREFKDEQAALRWIPGARATLTQLHQENAELRRKPEESAKVTSEELFENPGDSLRKLGYIKGSDVDDRIRTQMDQESAKGFMASAPRWSELEPAMAAIAAERPSFMAAVNSGALSRVELAKTLYELAEKRTGKTTQVRPSDAERRSRAVTSGNSGGTKREGSRELKKFMSDYDEGKISDEDFEKAVGFSG